jgi:MYXO-CTERM domain-containing protein
LISVALGNVTVAVLEPSSSAWMLDGAVALAWALRRRRPG